MLNHDEILAMCDRYFPGLTFTKHSEPHHVNQLYRAVIKCNDIHFRLDITVKGAIVEAGMIATPQAAQINETREKDYD